eukprot:GHVH01004775.1.p1 GENE.GHVH01004775.1~~GHVH01004775.1.p1  ORF type:complete len:364 (+),score=61.60 GHVH01004775.1:101-1192(+)
MYQALLIGQYVSTIKDLLKVKYTPQLIGEMLCSLCSIVFGMLWRFYIGIKVLEAIWWSFERMFGPFRSLRDLGPWTVVTGATDGIGQGMAIHAWLEGQNIFLIGRNEAKLASVVQELEALKSPETGQEVETFCADLNDLSDLVLDQLVSKLKSLSGTLGLLINSAGVSYDSATRFEELSPGRIESIINLNLTTTIRISQRVYQIMKEQQRGGIVCLGSGSATLPSDPLYCVYAASKAGVSSFCESLRLEARENNILIQCHAPLMVPSKLSKAREGMIVPSLEDYVTDAMNIIKSQLLFPKEMINFGSSLYTPSFTHKIIVCVAQILPTFIWDNIRMKQNTITRERYLRKMAKTVDENTDCQKR